MVQTELDMAADRPAPPRTRRRLTPLGLGGVALALLAVIFAARIITLDPWGQAAVEKPKHVVPSFAQSSGPAPPASATAPPAIDSSSLSNLPIAGQTAEVPRPREVPRFDDEEDLAREIAPAPAIIPPNAASPAYPAPYPYPPRLPSPYAYAPAAPGYVPPFGPPAGSGYMPPNPEPRGSPYASPYGVPPAPPPVYGRAWPPAQSPAPTYRPRTETYPAPPMRMMPRGGGGGASSAHGRDG
jgi:hypothetical protein